MLTISCGDSPLSWRGFRVRIYEPWRRTEHDMMLFECADFRMYYRLTTMRTWQWSFSLKLNLLKMSQDYYF